MSGAVQSVVTAAGRGCAAALALALVLHGSTKRPPVRPTAAPAPSAARTLTDEDFARGFVRARTGRGEVHDFTPPANAVVCPDWRAFGAAEDWVYLSFTNWAFRVGTNAASRLRVHSFGRIEPIVRTAYSAKLGVTKESHDNMTPDLWVNYADRVRATHWFELFPEGDGRRLLTWKDRFASVTNVVNFYSTQEDVVCNGDGTLMPYGRSYAWYNQEYRKGSWGMMLHEYEGGWAFNPYYDTVTMQWNGSEFVEIRRRMSPQGAANLGDEQLRQHPFFLDFANPEMHTSPNGEIVATNYLYRAEMLAYAIPAESYAAGAKPLPNLSSEELNIDMAGFTDGQSDLPENGKKMKDRYRDWQHSTFVQRSYKRTYKLFKKLSNFIKENSHE